MPHLPHQLNNRLLTMLQATGEKNLISQMQLVYLLKGKTLFEMAETDPSLSYVCDYYLNIADQILARPEGVVPNDTPDRELFSLLSDFYLNPPEPKVKSEEEVLDLMMV